MINLAGIALNVQYPIVGIVTTTPVNFFMRSERIFVSAKINSSVFGYACCITNQNVVAIPRGSLIHSVLEIETLTDGDIVLVTPEGRINVMYQSCDADHTVFITNRCNSCCIMCPQPPSNDPPDLQDINQKILLN